MQTHKHMTIPMGRRVVERHEYPNGGFSESIRRLPDGTLTGLITLEVDVEGILLALGERALRNRSKRASALRGYITARATELVREGKLEVPATGDTEAGT